MSIQKSVDVSLDTDGEASIAIELTDISKDIELKASAAGISGGSSDYNHIANKPKINGSTLVGDKTFEDLGLSIVTDQEIDKMIFGGWDG